MLFCSDFDGFFVKIGLIGFFDLAHLFYLALIGFCNSTLYEIHAYKFSFVFLSDR